MGDMGEVFNAMKQADKERRENNLDKADLSGFTKHTYYHYSMTLQEKRLDYWPSKNKWRWNNKTYHGNVQQFIKKRL